LSIGEGLIGRRDALPTAPNSDQQQFPVNKSLYAFMIKPFLAQLIRSIERNELNFSEIVGKFSAINMWHVHIIPMSR
jgi:hypothetical protein